jgi:hypothetical protein
MAEDDKESTVDSDLEEPQVTTERPEEDEPEQEVAEEERVTLRVLRPFNDNDAGDVIVLVAPLASAQAARLFALGLVEVME